MPPIPPTRGPRPAPAPAPQRGPVRGVHPNGRCRHRGHRHRRRRRAPRPNRVVGRWTGAAPFAPRQPFSKERSAVMQQKYEFFNLLAPRAQISLQRRLVGGMRYNHILGQQHTSPPHLNVLNFTTTPVVGRLPKHAILARSRGWGGGGGGSYFLPAQCRGLISIRGSRASNLFCFCRSPSTIGNR